MKLTGKSGQVAAAIAALGNHAIGMRAGARYAAALGRLRVLACGCTDRAWDGMRWRSEFEPVSPWNTKRGM